MSSNSNNKSITAKAKPFIFGGISGMVATTCIQPIDMIKVRIQLSQTGVNPIILTKNLIQQEGFQSLYKGLSAGLLRQATYTTARMGLFNTFLNSSKEYNNGKPVSFTQRAISGLAAGGLGAMIGTPADLALIRMQSDGLLPVAKRQNYKSVFHALSKITKSEGVLALWNGCGPTVARAMALNLGMLSTYAESKSHLEKKFGVNPYSKLGASAVAGFFASFFSLPFDFVKTRLQKSSESSLGSFQCAREILKNEGALAFYKGFGTFYFRIAPHAMVTLLVAEFLTGLDQKQQVVNVNTVKAST
ncbi:hypothetical protein HK099_007980 [Clydaea vesicula]|uniref:Uncharacterized protein n=1 Tax=Clydaea vesicula TaxID=447962 RepID=A0AAD5U988_9FUNG|nr:hypothetical protein HK099_007980 [Clydaea vesicula]